MRICLVVHGFPPVERAGVEYYTEGLCRALAQAGHRVEVFVPRRDPLLADLALRREERGGYAVNWLTHNHPASGPREALLVPELKGAFAAFLERERPEVVHFHHLYKVGIDLVAIARERGLPTVYTAHDYYPVCHRYTLLRPDLSRCDARGDSAACSRCDLAISHLNEQSDLGDYHVGVLREQLTEPAWEKLQAILAGHPETHGVLQGTVQWAFEQRAELDRLRADAYRGFDLVLSPSRTLIAELERGGFERGRVRHQPLGFDNSDLAGLPPVRSDPTRPVRFAFLGGMTKHKGVHVLLDAYARVSGRSELAIWGDSNDRQYVGLLREKTSQVGAQWRGPYARGDAPGILAEIDAVVVPSIWVENQPLVIHEAFSAGRPVLASRLGAMGEYVRDGENGLLFAPGDPVDLARVLQRCVDEPALLPALARGIRPVKSMAEDARELAAHYERLVGERRAARTNGELPASLRGPLASFQAISDLPARELLARVLGGLDELRGAWSADVGDPPALALLAEGLGEGSEAQDRLREARNEIAWLRTKKEELDEGREELMVVFEDLDKLLNETKTGSQRQAAEMEAAGTYLRQKELEALAAHERLRMLEGVIAEKNRYIGEVEGHLHEAARYIKHKDREYLDVEAELRKASADARAKEEELRRAFEEASARQFELRAAEERIRAQEAEAKRASEVERQQAEELRVTQEVERLLDRTVRSSAQVGVLAVQAQERVLNRALRPILERLHALLDPRGRLQLPADGASFAELLANINRAREGLDVVGNELEWMRPMSAELEWRRERMRKLVFVFEHNPLLRFMLKGTALGRRLNRWSHAHTDRKAPS